MPELISAASHLAARASRSRSQWHENTLPSLFRQLRSRHKWMQMVMRGLRCRNPPFYLRKRMFVVLLCRDCPADPKPAAGGRTASPCYAGHVVAVQFLEVPLFPAGKVQHRNPVVRHDFDNRVKDPCCCAGGCQT